MTQRNVRRMATLVCGAAFQISIVACGTIPDLEPYAQSTAALHSAVSSSHDLLYKELSTLHRFYPDDSEFATFPDRFSTAWQPRIQVMEAMVTYSDSLAAIAQAAKDGQKNAASLAESLQTFVGAAGGPIGLAASPVGAKIFTALSAAVIEIKAAGKLEEAISAADPVIQELSELIIKDYADLESLLAPDKLESSLEAAIKQRYIKEFGADPAYRKELIKLQKNALVTIHEAQVKVPFSHSDLKQAEERLTQLNEWLTATNQWYEKQAGDLKQMQARFASQRLVLAKAKKGIQEWSTIHRDLAANMKKGKQRPNYRLLYNTAKEIRTILDEGNKP
jgi:hypothetical protein